MGFVVGKLWKREENKMKRMYYFSFAAMERRMNVAPFFLYFLDIDFWTT